MILTKKRVWLGTIGISIMVAVFFAFNTVRLPIFTARQNPTQLEHAQKIETGFNKLRYANNVIESQAIEAQLFVDLSQARLASTNLLFESAQKLAEDGEYNRALELYTTIQNHEPDFAEAYVNGAYMSFELGEKESALAMLKRAVKLEPRHFAAWFGIGSLLDEKGDLKGAKTAFEKALFYNPNFDSAERALFAIEAKTNGISF